MLSTPVTPQRYAAGAAAGSSSTDERRTGHTDDPGRIRLELGKPSLREDPAEAGIVLADFPVSETAGARWMSLFSARVARSAANAWTVTGQSIRLRTSSTLEALRAGIATLRQVVTHINDDYDGVPQAEPVAAFQRVIDDEFDRR